MPHPGPFPLQDDEVTTASVDEVVAACEKVLDITKEGTFVKRISENAVVKLCEFLCLSEARTMQFVAANTSIRVPHVIRSFEVPLNEGRKKTYIVMEYVRGKTVEECWPEMSEERRQIVVDQVLSAISELQSIEMERPGPIGGGRSKGYMFSEGGAGPFNSVRELEDYFTDQLNYAKRLSITPPDAHDFTGTFGKMVMSHVDLAEHNIILEDGYKVCVIDWGFAGAYPAHFERCSLLTMKPTPFAKRIAARLTPYEQEIKDLHRLEWVLVFGRDSISGEEPECWRRRMGYSSS